MNTACKVCAGIGYLVGRKGELAHAESDYPLCRGPHLFATLGLRDEQPTIAPPAPFVTAQVALGEEHACVLGRDGSVWCVGDNDHRGACHDASSSASSSAS